MPLVKPKDREDHIGPELRVYTRAPQRLTRELLRSLTAALEAVLVTPESHRLPGVRWALVGALKQLDRLWPYALGGADVQEAEGAPEGAEAGDHFGPDGRSGHWADGRAEGAEA